MEAIVDSRKRWRKMALVSTGRNKTPGRVMTVHPSAHLSTETRLWVGLFGKVSGVGGAEWAVRAEKKTRSEVRRHRITNCNDGENGTRNRRSGALAGA